MSVPVNFTPCDERDRLRGRGDFDPTVQAQAEDLDMDRREAAADVAMDPVRRTDGTGLAPQRFKTARPVGAFGRPLQTP